MKLIIAILAAVLMVAATPIPARGQGINLSWSDCGTHGTSLRTFACNTNVGVNSLVGSFVPGAFVDSVTAGEAIIDVQTWGPPSPTGEG